MESSSPGEVRSGNVQSALVRRGDAVNGCVKVGLDKVLSGTGTASNSNDLWW